MSAFLHFVNGALPALGEALLRSSLVALAVVSASALLLLAWRRLPPFAVALVWWLVALRILLELAGVPGIALPLLPAAAAPGDVRETVPLAAPALTSSSSFDPSLLEPVPAPSAVRSPFAPLAIAVLAWGVGAALVAGFEVRRTLRIAAVVRRARWTDEPALVALARAAEARLGLRRAVPILVSDEISTPMVVGLVAPRLLLPAELSLAPAELELVLLHELAHVRRRDALRALVPALARRLLWFHPLVRYVEREFALATEAACDALVLERAGAAPQRYGRLLVRFAAEPDAGALTAQAFASRPAGNRIRRRIEMLVSPPLARRQLLVALPLVALVALAVALPVRLVAAPPAPPAAPLAPAAPFAPMAPALEALELPAPPAPSHQPGVRYRRGVPPRAPLAPVAPMSPVAFAAPAAPSAPTAPSAPDAPTAPQPPAPSAWAGLDEVDAVVYRDSEAHWSIDATDAERRQVEALAADGEPALLLRRDGKTRIVRDRATLVEVRRLLEQRVVGSRWSAREIEAFERAHEALARRLERQQEAIGEAAARLAERNAEIAERVEEIARERAERLDLDHEELEAAADRLARRAERQVEVSRRQIERRQVVVERSAERRAARAKAWSERDFERRLERGLERSFDRRTDDELEELLERLLDEDRDEQPK